MSRDTASIDSCYRRNSHGMRVQSNLRSFLTKEIDKFHSRVTEAALRYESRPLLSNFPKFSQLQRRYQGRVRAFWTELDKLILRQNQKALMDNYKNVLLPQIQLELTQLISQMEEFLDTTGVAPDATLINQIRLDLRRKYDSEFDLINLKYDRVLLVAALVAVEVDRLAYFDGLLRAYRTEIEGLLETVHDQNSITNLRSVIERNAKDLINELDKIERIANGESPNSSFVISDDDSIEN